MRVLVACEFSGVVRRAFRALGHDAWSCDLLPAEDGDKHHFMEDILLEENYGESEARVLDLGWDLMIAHPPCTYLAVSGAIWWSARRREQEDARQFFMRLVEAPCERIAIENPVGAMSSFYRKPDQIIHPWQFGHGETKATCLWLKGLPKLKPTNIVEGREARIHKMPPGPNRWKERSRTYDGIAKAMAEQWGGKVK